MTARAGLPEVRLHVEHRLLSIPHTLDCGQAFRWRTRAGGWWLGALRDRAVRLRQEQNVLVAQLFPPIDGAAELLRQYLRLDVDLAALHERLASRDPWIARAVEAFPGLRVLDQDADETLITFLCTPANFVARIKSMVEALSRRFGRALGSFDGDPLYSFPSVQRLAEATEAELAECGLGYRATTVRLVAGELSKRPEGWAEGLRKLPYGEAKARLMELPGVGPKIADCVCLFALGKDEAVPVDTHIWAIARELFGLQIRTKSLTPATYDTVVGLFQQRYGPYAGWAQQYLYMHHRTLSV